MRKIGAFLVSPQNLHKSERLCVTVFENSTKSLILQLYKIEGCGQTVLPVIFKRTKIGEKIPKFKWDILTNFQTMWKGSGVIGSNIRSQEFSFFP